jgi:type I restriction enzyme S subunit
MISKIKCCIHDGFVYFPDLKKGQEFLYRIFETGRPYVGLGKHGTQLNLNTETIANIKIPFPPLEEQTAIANFLDHKTAQIDKAIAQKGQLIELLKERRQILIHEAVTQGLDKSVEMKDSGVEWIGDVPKHWEVKKLGYLTTRIGDGLHGTPNYTDDATYYFINGNNLGNEKIKITEQTKTVNIKEYLLHKKDLSGNTILLSINGTIGNVSYYNYEPIMLGKSAAYINLLSNVNIRYIRLFLQSSIFKNYYELELSGSTIKNLSLHSIGKTPIVIPPKEEQQEIVSYIEAQNEKIKTAIKLKQQEIASLKEYKTVLIDAAVTGKVIVD